MAERDLRREMDGANGLGVAAASANGTAPVWARARGMNGHWAGAESVGAEPESGADASEGMVQW
jgi:hypothetical protein